MSESDWLIKCEDIVIMILQGVKTEYLDTSKAMIEIMIKILYASKTFLCLVQDKKSCL